MYPGQNKYRRFKMNSKKEINITNVIKEDLKILKTVGKTTVITSNGYIVEGDDFIFANSFLLSISSCAAFNCSSVSSNCSKSVPSTPIFLYIFLKKSLIS